jgi:peroxiredoxin
MASGVALAEPPAAKKLDVGQQAPAFRIKDASGQLVDLAELTARGPVLVRLTCGCSGCDQELAYFQRIHDAYKAQGLTCLFVFKEPDAKVAAYAAAKKLTMRYAVDSQGASWATFRTKAMPSNFLIAKGGKIAAITTGCDARGLMADKVSVQAAKILGIDPVKVRQEGVEKKGRK